MLSSQETTNTGPTSIYSKLFETNEVPRFIKDDAPLVVDATNPSRFLTFSELRKKVRALAIALRREPFHLQEGDIILYCSKDEIECPVALFGIASAGCTACLLPSRSPVSDIRRIVESAPPKAVVAHPDTIDAVKQVWPDGKIPVPVLMMDTPSVASAAIPGTTAISQYYKCTDKHATLPAVDPETPAYMILTSGSSGSPKLVKIPQRAMVARIQHANGFGELGLEEHGKPGVLVITHCAFISWFIITTSCIRYGVPLYMLDYWHGLTNQDLVLSKVQQFGATMIFFLESQSMARIAHQFKDTDIAKHNLSTLRVVYSGGQIIPDEVLRLVAEKLQTTTIHIYGSTEADVIFALSNKRFLHSPLGLYLNKEKSPLIDMKLIDSNGQEVPVGVEGELCVKSPMNALGYQGRPDITEKSFDSQGYYHTGDIFMKDHEGNYAILGRMTDVIQAIPVYFFPKQLEDICLSFGGIKECAAVGAYSTKHAQEFPRAYIVPTDDIDFDENKVQELMAYVESQVPMKHWRLEGGVKVLERLPVAPSRKVDRYKLRKMARVEIDEAFNSQNE